MTTINHETGVPYLAPSILSAYSHTAEPRPMTPDQMLEAWRQDTVRLDWLSLPENYDVEFVLSPAGYRIQQPQRIPGTERFEEVLLTSRDWPTLRDALDEAIQKGGRG